MGDRVILTDKREQLIEDGYDPSNNTERVRKSRLENSAETAFEELIRIAKSPHIDQTKIFDEDQVFRLLRALLNPNLDHYAGEVPLLDDGEQHTEDFQAYRDRLYVQLDKSKVYRQNVTDDGTESNR